MNKKAEALTTWLDKRIAQHSKSERLDERMKKDVFKQVKGYAERESWDDCCGWLKKQHEIFKRSDMKGPRMMAGSYKEALTEIWRINKKWKKFGLPVTDDQART